MNSSLDSIVEFSKPWAILLKVDVFVIWKPFSTKFLKLKTGRSFTWTLLPFVGRMALGSSSFEHRASALEPSSSWRHFHTQIKAVWSYFVETKDCSSNASNIMNYVLVSQNDLENFKSTYQCERAFMKIYSALMIVFIKFLMKPLQRAHYSVFIQIWKMHLALQD